MAYLCRVVRSKLKTLAPKALTNARYTMLEHPLHSFRLHDGDLHVAQYTPIRMALENLLKPALSKKRAIFEFRKVPACYSPASQHLILPVEHGTISVSHLFRNQVVLLECTVRTPADLSAVSVLKKTR